MCCVLYYLYIKCRDYFRKPPQQEEEEEDDNQSEIKYNAKQLNEYVRRKQRTYWVNYDE